MACAVNITAAVFKTHLQFILIKMSQIILPSSISFIQNLSARIEVEPDGKNIELNV